MTSKAALIIALLAAPLVAADVSEVPMLDEQREAYRRENVQSMLAVPLVLSGEFVNTRDVAETREDLGGGHLGHQHDDEVLHDLALTPDFARCRSAEDARHPPERLHQRPGLVRGVVGEAVGAGLAEEGDTLADVVGGLLAEPGQSGEPAVGGGGLQFRQ